MNFIFLCLHGCHLAISIDLIRFNTKSFLFFKVNSDLLKKIFFLFIFYSFKYFLLIQIKIIFPIQLIFFSYHFFITQKFGSYFEFHLRCPFKTSHITMS